jgi:Mg-chelatase subunit ChlD
VKGGGRTALGPALALAMGIISMHDQGSRIIMVTDSMPNFGILTSGDSDYVYKKIGNCLKENGATLSILKWTGDELRTKE